MIGASFAILIIAILLIFSGIGFAWVIYQDSRKRGVSDFSATIWAIGIFLLSPVILPLYLLVVVRSQARTSPFGNGELWLIWLYCSLFFPLLLTGVFSPPDPFTQLSRLVVLLPLFALVMYLLVFKLFTPSPESPA